MFAAWGTWVARFRRPVFAVTLVAVIVAGAWGLGVFGQLSEGGYNDPGSESTRAAEAVQDALGARGGDVVVIYTPSRSTVDDAVLGQRVENRLAALPRHTVSASTSYWQDDTAQYVSKDNRSAVAVLTLSGADDSEKLESFRAMKDRLSVEGASTQIAGGAALGDASAELSTKDLALAEAISLPIVLVLLLFLFGSLVAAALPVMVGGAAVLGSLGVLHAIALTHDVNSFAVNVASLLGLGMAIDYGLFMVGRFREEQEYGRDPAEAVARTVATAGRTVLFSATLLMIALAGLLLFPQGFLKSLAYGGLAAVALAAVLSLTMLPALLAILGPRVDKLPIRLPKRTGATPAGTGWARLADVVLRRPVVIAVPLIIGLLLLAAPIAGVQFGETDERVLPAGNPSREAIETLKTDFPALSSVGIQVVLRGAGSVAPSAATGERFAAQVAKVPGIAAVTAGGTGDDILLLTATLTGKDPFSTAARDAVEDIRALPPPSGVQMLVGGTTARNVDSLTATADRLPLMVALLVGATLALMFLAFGSVLLPIKAVLVSALSLSATFGILVWIFQDGHGAGLLQVTPAPLEVGTVVLMAAVVFGLSTDYEVFLLSRMVEARTRGASTPEAVTTGLARTGRVISAAALLLIVVTGAFALSSVTSMRFVGIGMIIALILDATVVRMLLVPAILGIMGDAAWWAPRPLRRLQERAGLAEYAGEELFPTVSVGRHASPDSAVARSSSVAVRPRHASWSEPAGSSAGPSAGSPAELPAGAARAAIEAGPSAGSPAELPAGAARAAIEAGPSAGAEGSPGAPPPEVVVSASAPGPMPAPSDTAPSDAEPAPESVAAVSLPEEPVVAESGAEETPVQVPTGEQEAVGAEADDQDDDGEQTPVLAPSGEQPTVNRTAGPASGEPSAADQPQDPPADPDATVVHLTAPVPEAPATTDGPDPETLETVDLAAHVAPPSAIEPADAPNQDPDSTAVLEMDQTVDLSSRVTSENSRRT